MNQRIIYGALIAGVFNIYSVILHLSCAALTRFLISCRVAGRGCPRPAPSEPCMGLSIHTAQASTKASFDTRYHNYIFRHTNNSYGN